ncbi:hypothetical protein Q4489_14850 [Thalassotalea sp. 1_MG-2023]|uniref:hypothetical protein n=1 Tax=Thalassotalea sp. 1_MG-2023 TaxID=3062680 RepID=UPI0026E3C08D|nr:hypothetical protein [Thalassotalea sp. 1_MG-2023]MDO6428296.1 hypothetical protein [Thalassotalea sp. 1_MG-2023]
MNTIVLRYFPLLLCLLFTPFTWSSSKTLAPELMLFKDYLGTWQSQFPVGKGQPEVEDVARWERALNGMAIRTLHSINQGEYGGESLIFYDKEKQKIVFYYFTTAGFYTTGHMELVDEKTLIAYEEVSGNKEGITQVKSTNELLGNSMKVSTSYLKKGTWTTPETRVYQRSDKQVVFK